jgi:Tfp pilus assembly protein PilN
MKRIWSKTKEAASVPVQVGWAVAACVLFFACVAFLYNQATTFQEQVTQQSQDDVRDMLQNTLQACTVLVKTREQDIEQWDDLFDTLAEVLTSDGDQALIERLRIQTEENLPHISITECLLTADR